MATIPVVQTLLRAHLNAGSDRQMPAIMLWGPPGVGKSSIVRDIARDAGVDFVDIRLSQRDPVDLRGLPTIVDGRVRWLVGSEWPSDPHSRGILLLDELSAVDRTLQVAAYELILDRRIGDQYRLPDGWLVVGAGNRQVDRAVAQPMSSALANRFLHLEVTVDPVAWLGWARQSQLHPHVVAFIDSHPKHLLQLPGSAEADRGWPSPRSWERVSTLWTLSAGWDEPTRMAMVEGLVGPQAAAAFLSFCQVMDDASPILDILEGRVAWTVPRTADQVRADLRAMVQLVAGTTDPVQSLDRVLEAILASRPSIGAAALLELLQTAPALALRLPDSPHFTALAVRHGALLSGPAANTLQLS